MDLQCHILMYHRAEGVNEFSHRFIALIMSFVCTKIIQPHKNLIGMIAIAPHSISSYPFVAAMISS